MKPGLGIHPIGAMSPGAPAALMSGCVVGSGIVLKPSLPKDAERRLQEALRGETAR